ncbi:hypothetical protein ILUMI_00998 [Ignelater luminosus]|uniref:O-acyltransferase n=1 Tax=Ignelater luminosus TaxID=2038154 RepID=A0A8K0DJ57_IGNLU|nr:hypothetical protein ILUMI_00998 [Ignelater luminosus]
MDLINRSKKTEKSAYYEDGEVIDKIKHKPGELPKKQFAPRNSVLTDLWEIKHIRTIYHIFLAMLFGLFINTAAYDYLNKGEVRLGFNLIIKGFSKFHFLLIIWKCMFLVNFLVYYGFKLWATIRIQVKPKTKYQLFWDRSWIVLIITYYLGFIYFFTSTIIKMEMPPAASITLLSEITRFLMKSHAFIRSNAPIVLKYKSHNSKGQERYCPKLGQFLYFCFVPTLIYQDSYPRTNRIRWSYVAYCFLEVIGVIFYLSFLFERFLVATFEDYGLKPYRWQDIILTILSNTAAGMLIMLTTWYAVLHAWMNGFAEMVRFADRMFYKDWWSSTTYDRYYRTWNVVIHDWLYTYIYKDFIEIVLLNNRIAAKYIVFFLSAAFHEYILGFTFRFCLPILFVQFFGVGVAMTYLKFKQNCIGNTVLWYTNALGMSMNTAAFAIEYYCRANRPIENVTISSYFIPQMFQCNEIYN